MPPRIHIDKCVVEVFTHGRQDLVAVHADHLGKPDLTAFTVNTPFALKKIKVWKLKPTNQGFSEAQKRQIWKLQTT